LALNIETTKGSGPSWDNIRGALVGVAATKLEDFLAEVIPGFDQEYRKRAGKSLRESAGVPRDRELAQQNTGNPGSEYSPPS
jgi:hypothetical protein